MSKSENSGTRPNILLLMSGSIACAKASSLISEWAKRGSKVRVVCTRAVGEFIGNSTLQGLGAELVFDNIFTPGQAMEHISLGKWADIIIAAPATSNLINKLSTGIADDAVSTVWQAAYGQGKLMLVVPAMNTRMWRYPATRESVKRLQQWGIHVLPVAKGELACGEHGEGRMLEPAGILQTVERLLAFDRHVTGKRILITAGGTRERIDSVRYIGNMSSGRTASRLADELSAAGHELTWLGAENAIRPDSVNKLVTYYSFADLEAHLRELLSTGDHDIVIHAAAVSDFSVAALESGDGNTPQQHGKLSSDSDLLLRLKPNPKLLGQLKNWSANPDLKVIGFKLTDTDDPRQHIAAVKKQFDHSNVDAVVHNDLSDISEKAHSFNFYASLQKPVHCADGKILANTINQLMETVT
jgi:phosphopantothenoylcysteine decarboxylase/phosphopantothenate--cysteine ligase